MPSLGAKRVEICLELTTGNSPLHTGMPSWEVTVDEFAPSKVILPYNTAQQNLRGHSPMYWYFDILGWCIVTRLRYLEGLIVLCPKKAGFSFWLLVTL